MTTVLPQELSLDHDVWLRSPPVNRCLMGSAISFGTASTWSGSFGPSPGLTSLAMGCTGASRAHPALTGNTGWSPDQYRTVVLFYPVGHNGLWEHDADQPMLLNYDLAVSAVAPTDVYVPRAVQEPEAPRPQMVIAEISRWTGLSTSRLGELLGVARRSLYNWLEGRPISRDMQQRVEQVHSALAQVREERGPDSARAWLDEGDPSNFELLRGQRWAVIEERLGELRPTRAVRVDEKMPLLEEDEHELATQRASRDALLALFVASQPTESKPRPVWVPREVIGATPFDEDDESES